MKTVFTFVVLLAACFRGEGQLLLSPGDQWTYQFEVLPRTGSTGSATAQISWATNFADYGLEYATNLPVTVWNPRTV